MEKADVIVGGPAPGIAGSKKFRCDKCGSSVWLAPSGQQIRNTGVKVWCVACATDLPAGSKVGIAPGVLAELSGYRRRN